MSLKINSLINNNASRGVDTKAKALMQAIQPTVAPKLTSLNKILTDLGENTLNLTDAETQREFQEELYELYSTDKKAKALIDGTTAGRGEALLGTEYERDLDIRIPDGRGFQRAGVRLRTNFIGDFEPATATAGRRSPFVGGTPSLGGNGDAQPDFKRNPLTLTQRNALVGVGDLLAGRFMGGVAQLYLRLEEMMAEYKLLDLDELLATNITTLANGADFFPAGTGSFGITKRMGEMLYGDGTREGILSRKTGKPFFAMSPEALNLYLSQQSSDGNFSNKNEVIGFIPNPQNQGVLETGETGLVGYFVAGAIRVPIYQVNGILDTYTTDVNNVITDQTGGSSTAIIAGVATQAEMATGRSELEALRRFGTESGSQAEFFAGQEVIGSKYYGGAVMRNEDFFKVLAL